MNFCRLEFAYQKNQKSYASYEIELMLLLHVLVKLGEKSRLIENENYLRNSRVCISEDNLRCMK